MKTEYERITFMRVGFENKKDIYGCYHKKLNSFIGLVQQHPLKKKFFFYIEEKTFISAECLRELSDFTYQLNNQ